MNQCIPPVNDECVCDVECNFRSFGSVRNCAVVCNGNCEKGAVSKEKVEADNSGLFSCSFPIGGPIGIISSIAENKLKLIWFQQHDAVVIWFAMESAAVDHVRSIVKNLVTALLMMELLMETLVWPVKWIQTVPNVGSMLLLTNRLAFVIFNVSDLVETVSWFVPMVASIQPLQQLPPQPLLQRRLRLPQLQPLQRQQLQQKSVKDAGLHVQSTVDQQRDLMIRDGSGRILMTIVVFLNCVAIKIVILAVNVIIWNYAELKCAHPKQFVTKEIVNVHLDTLRG